MHQKTWALSTALLCALALTACIELPAVEPGGPTTPTDLTPPLLNGTVPGNAAVAPVNTRIELSFSKPMDTGSVTVSAVPAITLGTPTWNADQTQVTFQPAAGLLDDTRYTLTVSGRDPAGNSLDGQNTLTFTTARKQAAPTLSASTPAHGSTYVAVNTQVVLTFSEPMNPTQLSVVLSPATANLSNPTWSSDNRTVTFTPAPVLRYGTDYTLSLQGQDAAGSALAATTVRFMTQSLTDTTPPRVQGSTPADNAPGVDINANLSLSFSEAMDTASTQAAFSINPNVIGTLSWNQERTLLTFDPTASLDYSKVYTVTLGTGAMDAAGNKLASPYSFKFTTSNAPDLTQPQVIGYSPTYAQTGMSRSQSISVTFSEPMDKQSTQNAFTLMSPSEVSGTFSWSADGRTMTFTPSTVIDYGTYVSWRITTMASDVAGNPLQAQHDPFFRVIQQVTVDLPLVSGGDGDIAYDITRKTYSLNTTNTRSTAGLTYKPESSGNGGPPTFYPQARRIFMTFDLSLLPLGLTAITAASMNVYVNSVSSDVFSRFGDLNVSSVNYGSSLDTADYENAVVFSSTPWRPNTIGWHAQGVLSAVNDDWRNQGARGKRSQFRLHFNVPDNLTSSYGTQLSDALLSVDSERGTYKPYLKVVYEIP